MRTFEKFLEEKGITKDDFAAKSVDEMAALQKEYNELLRKDFTDAVEAGASKEDITKLTTDFNEALVKQQETLNEALKEMGLAIKKSTEIKTGDTSLTAKQSLDKELEDNKDALKAMVEGGGKVTLKTVGDMTIVGNISGGNVPVEQREPGLNRVARRRIFIRELVNNGTAVSNVISWVEQTGIEGAPAGTVEGTLKNQIDFDLVVVSESVKKRTAFIKISTEMLGDIDFMRSEINNELTERLSLDIDDQILNGDDSGQNLNGILALATAYSAGVFTGTLTASANLVDVLTTAADQVIIANHIPNVHVVHPSAMTALRLIKDTDKQYISRLQDADGTMMLDGIPIVTNTGIAVDTFLTMDGTKDTVFSKGAMTIQVGLDSDDFTKNFRTVLIEWRGLNRIKGNDTTAFVTGGIAAALTALNA